ncbi:hypothetical protein F-M6_0168 [Faustovirus]|nr:hypothetical protein F-M6_0168 [Faustovirus]
MDTIPPEIVDVIITYNLTDNVNFYDMPAIALTCRRFYKSVRTCIRTVKSLDGAVYSFIKRKLIDYYVQLGSTTGIDFAQDLTRNLSKYNITICLYLGYNDILNYIINKYGLIQPDSPIYTTHLLTYGTVEILQRFIELGFKPEPSFIHIDFALSNPSVLKMMIGLLTAGDLEIVRAMTNTLKWTSILDWVTSADDFNEKYEATLAENCKTMIEAGLLTRSEYCEAIYKLYHHIRYSHIRDCVLLSRLVVELYNDSAIILHLPENPRRPTITAIFANAPHLVINYQV